MYPDKLQYVSKIKVDSQGTIYYIDLAGVFRVFNVTLNKAVAISGIIDKIQDFDFGNQEILLVTKSPLSYENGKLAYYANKVYKVTGQDALTVGVTSTFEVWIGSN